MEPPPPAVFDWRPSRGPRRSPAWDHFLGARPVHPSKVPAAGRCIHCGDVIQMTGGSTTGLLRHLEAKHEILLHPPDPAQSKMATYFPTSQTLPTHPVITGLLVRLIVEQFLSFSFIEAAALKQLLALLAPSYSLPLREQISTRYVPAFYCAIRQKIAALLANITSYACTADIWTSLAGAAYLTVTIHFINDDWELCSFVLATVFFPSPHNGSRLKELFEDILTDWKLSKEALVCVVTDTASNNISFANLAGIEWLGCFAHRLHLSVVHALDSPGLKEVLGRARKMVTFFHRSSKGLEALYQQLEFAQKEKLKPVLDVVTRWTSTAGMINSLLRIGPLVFRLTLVSLGKEGKILSDQDWKVLETFQPALELLAEATELLQTAKTASVSFIWLIRDVLATEFAGVIPVDGMPLEMVLLAQFKSFIWLDISSRWDPAKVPSLVTWATLLDPRCHNPNLLPGMNVVLAWTQLEGQALEIIGKERPPSPPSPPDPDPKRVKVSILDRIRQRQPANFITGQQVVQQQIRAFREEPCIDPAEDVLKWWQRHQGQYPTLAKLAQKYLAIPATSAPSERIFSIAGLTLNNRRLSLHPSKVDKLVFLHHNLHELERLHMTVQSDWSDS